jgi:hypothetical protein
LTACKGFPFNSSAVQFDSHDDDILSGLSIPASGAFMAVANGASIKFLIRLQQQDEANDYMLY